MYIKNSRINDLIDAIYQATKNVRPLNLKIKELKKDSNRAVGIDIELSTELNNIYKELMKITEDFEEQGNRKGFLLNPEEKIWPGAEKWVANYRNKYKYNPHITLAKDSEIELPQINNIGFIANRFAICHLGNYCTCRKIIKEWKLVKKIVRLK